MKNGNDSNSILAAIIVRELINSKLLDSEDRLEVQSLVEAGTITEAGWEAVFKSLITKQEGMSNEVETV